MELNLPQRGEVDPAKPDRVGRMANERARSLRQNLTEAELILRTKLRELRPAGLHFRRQAPIDRYIADFACHRAKLIVEVDGDQHGLAGNRVHDAQRTAFLESRGYTVIRFGNWEVRQELSRVLDFIMRVAQTHPTRRAGARRPPRFGGG